MMALRGFLSRIGISRFLILGLICGYFHQTQASWWYLGVASLAAQQPKETCLGVPGLVLQQIEICKNNPNAIWCVGEGVRLGIKECKQQFKHERWNCTTLPNNEEVFGPVILKGTRESAFVRAVTAAGVVQAVTQACSAGNLTDCSCDLSREGDPTEEGWKWGGCSDDVAYGVWFAKTFVDAPEAKMDIKDIRQLVNLHNNEAGRQAVVGGQKRVCRCHGVSGSCAVKSCWMAMPSFRAVGEYLKKRYEAPVEVSSRSQKKTKLRRRQRSLRRVPIDKQELVYVDESPNFCRADAKTGISGTKGRECRIGKGIQDSCDLLCCGRGYNTHVERTVERCHCKFVWCCHVKCKACETMIEKHKCK